MLKTYLVIPSGGFLSIDGLIGRQLSPIHLKMSLDVVPFQKSLPSIISVSIDLWLSLERSIFRTWFDFVILAILAMIGPSLELLTST